jgi:hypothetical protein
MTALRKLVGYVAEHGESVVSAAGEVAVESVALIVVAIAVVSAEASGGNGVAIGAVRGAVSESSLRRSDSSI